MNRPEVGGTYLGKYVASCQWQPLDRIGTIWPDVWTYLFDLLRIFWSCQGRGREFESRFPLQIQEVAEPRVRAWQVVGKC